MKFYNEGSTVFLQVKYLDKDNKSTIPTKAEWRLDNIGLNGCGQLQDWTDIPSPTASDEVTISAELNSNISTQTAKMQVTIRATDSSGNISIDPFIYTVRNVCAGT